MDPKVVIPFLVIFSSVMVGSCLIGWALYGGERGKMRDGGLFWALWKFLAVPWTITAAVSAVFFGVVWTFMQIVSPHR